MKNKIIISILVLLAIGAGVFFYLNRGKDKPNNEEKTISYTVKFDSNGGSAVKDKKINEGETLTLPENPTKEGYTFVRWEDKHATPIYNDALISGDIVLIAVWEKVEDKSKVEENSSTTKPSATKPEEPKPVTYVCEEGWDVSGKNCTNIKEVTYNCAKGYTKVGTTCIALSARSRVESNKTCKTKTINVGGGHTTEFEGKAMYDSADGKYYCYYGKVTDTQEQANESTCKSRSHAWVNGTCYYLKDDDYTHSCRDGYVYMSNPRTPMPNSKLLIKGCYPTKAAELTCESGYTLEKNVTLKNTTYFCMATKPASIK